MTANGSEKSGRMKNPWELIPLSDYENHMKLDSVMQLQALGQMMEGQLEDFPVSNVMILGVAGGNGLEHIKRDKFGRVYGVDINPDYLKETMQRYPDLEGVLECICVDLTKDAHKLPETELIIANLLIEYVGYECFKNVIKQVSPEFVSCIIQINSNDKEWVSDSPYLHAFDGLEQVHCQVEEKSLTEKMGEIGYHVKGNTVEYALPNGKKLVRVDFEK